MLVQDHKRNNTNGNQNENGDSVETIEENNVDIGEISVTPKDSCADSIADSITLPRACFKWPNHSVVFQVTQCQPQPTDYIGILRADETTPETMSTISFGDWIRVCTNDCTDEAGSTTVVVDPCALGEGRYRAYLVRNNETGGGDVQLGV